MSNIFDRQNDSKALRYLQAARYCDKRENTIKYFQILISVVLCLVGIFFRYSEQIGFTFTVDQRNAISIWLSLISGVVVILQIFFSIYTNRMHIEYTNLMELYDNYVLGISENKFIMRAISEITIDNYAGKYAKKTNKFKNHYFDSPKETLSKAFVFENRRSEIFSSYKTLLSVKALFQCIWVGFFVAIIVICANFDDKFINTLVNILIPSLSIITIIVSSWHSLNEDLKKLSNNLTHLNKYKEDALKKSSSINLNSAIVLRTIQDSLFAYRMKSFNVPKIIAGFYGKEKTQPKSIEKQKTEKQKPTKNAQVTKKAKTTKNAQVVKKAKTTKGRTKTTKK